MYKIIYSEKVKDDLTKIKDFIILDNPIYALKTINSIIKTINLLENFPYI
jgi:plasmid stabilization system protein ParE